MLRVGRHLAFDSGVVPLGGVGEPVNKRRVAHEGPGVLERGKRLQSEELRPGQVVLVVGEKHGSGQLGAAQGLCQVEVVPVRRYSSGPVVPVLWGL